MSFSENPYKNITFHVTDEADVHLECSSCGGGWQTRWPTTITAAELIDAQRRHVLMSHGRTAEDFKDWH